MSRVLNYKTRGWGSLLIAHAVIERQRSGLYLINKSILLWTSAFLALLVDLRSMHTVARRIERLVKFFFRHVCECSGSVRQVLVNPSIGKRCGITGFSDNPVIRAAVAAAFVQPNCRFLLLHHLAKPPLGTNTDFDRVLLKRTVVRATSMKCLASPTLSK